MKNLNMYYTFKIQYIGLTLTQIVTKAKYIHIW
jgi:hypothetical protein